MKNLEDSLENFPRKAFLGKFASQGGFLQEYQSELTCRTLEFLRTVYQSIECSAYTNCSLNKKYQSFAQPRSAFCFCQIAFRNPVHVEPPAHEVIMGRRIITSLAEVIVISEIGVEIYLGEQ